MCSGTEEANLGTQGVSPLSQSVRLSSILPIFPLSSLDVGEEAVAGNDVWQGWLCGRVRCWLLCQDQESCRAASQGWTGYHSQGSKQGSSKGTPKTVIVSNSLSICLSFVPLLFFLFFSVFLDSVCLGRFSVTFFCKKLLPFAKDILLTSNSCWPREPWTLIVQWLMSPCFADSSENH